MAEDSLHGEGVQCLGVIGHVGICAGGIAKSNRAIYAEGACLFYCKELAVVPPMATLHECGAYHVRGGRDRASDSEGRGKGDREG